MSGLPRALRVLLGPLTALGLLLSVQGCSTSAAATTMTPGPTPASALQIYNGYVTTERVALVNQDEMLALLLLTDSQYSITQAAFFAAGATGHPVTGTVYGKPTLYVPKLTTYPQWFMAVVPEHPATGGAEQTEVLVFDKPDAETEWALSGSSVLNQGAPALGIAVDSAGYATALATSDPKPKLRPDIVGAMHATIADDGPSSAAAVAVAPGPETTGLYQVNAALARQTAAHQDIYTWALEGTSYPLFALRRTDGSALVFYTMTLITATVPVKLPPLHSTANLPTIPVPSAYRPLLPADQPPIQHQLTANATLSYVALDPAASSGSGRIQVIGSGGGPTYAHGS
ncbi:MAG: hypothetical protein ABR922_10615 [Streptosporangiaceae bacterium]